MINKPIAFTTIAVAWLSLLLAGNAPPLPAADQPQWGQAWTRNLVSSETNLPDHFNPETGHNIKWSIPLGTETHGVPIVAGGRIYIGTNNGEPRDPKHQGDRGVLMCLNESDGAFLWQLVVPKRDEDPFFDWPKSGICSPPTVEGDRVYLVSNRGEVMCLDAHGLTNGNDGPYQDEGAHMVPPGTTPLTPGPTDADILWLFDLTRGAGIWSHDAAHSSILIHGPHLYLNTGTGVDNTHRTIRTPQAPSLVVLDKATGQYLARDGEQIAPTIFHSTWSSPSLGTLNGWPAIFFVGGNGIVYAFEPLPHPTSHPSPSLSIPSAGDAVPHLKNLWQFDLDPDAPKQEVHRYHLNRREGPSNVYGMPVWHEGKLYVAGGGDIFWGKLECWLQCIRTDDHGDVTASHQLWSYPLQRHVLATPAVWNGLAFVADVGRVVHCVDALTGQPYWSHETQGDFWASPLVADGKVYLGTRRGDFWIFAASKEKQILSTLDLGAPISATVTAANQTLYIATMNRLLAVALMP